MRQMPTNEGQADGGVRRRWRSAPDSAGTKPRAVHPLAELHDPATAGVLRMSLAAGSARRADLGGSEPRPQSETPHRHDGGSTARRDDGGDKRARCERPGGDGKG